MAELNLPQNPPIQPLGLVGETVQPVPNIETRTEDQYFQDVTTPTGLKPIRPDLVTPAQPDPWAGFQDAGFDQFQDAPDEFAAFSNADDLDLKSVEDLDKDRENFRPVDYFTNNPDVAKDPKKLAKLLEVYRRRDAEGLTAKGVAKAMFSKETGGVLADIGGGIKRIGERAIDVAIQPTANVVLGALTGDLFDDKKRAALFDETRRTMKKGSGEVSAGAESATVGLVDLARTADQKISRGTITSFDDLPRTRVSRPKDISAKPKTDQELLAQLADDAAFRQNAESISRGEGEFAKTVGLDKETLAKQGIELDENAIRQLSLVDPVTMVATGGAFKLVGFGGKVLATARTLDGAQQVADKLAKLAKVSIGKTVSTAGRAITGTGKALQGAGKLVTATAIGSALGTGGDVLTAAALGGGAKLIGPGLRKVGPIITHTGKAIAGEVPVSANFQRLLDVVKPVAGAVDTVAGGAFKGIAAAAPFAVAAQDDETAGALLGAGAALGAAGGAGAGAFRVVKSSASRRYFGENRPVLPDVPSQAYGFDAALDAQHEANIQKLSAQDASELNNFREALRQQGGEIYAVDQPTFRQKVAEEYRARTGQQIDPALLDTYQNHSAFFDTTNGDRKVVYLNSDTKGLQHDAGHIFDAVLAPEKRAELRSAVESAFTPEQRQAFRDTYERRVGSKISDTAAVDEFIAEQFAALFNNVPVTELNAPKSLLNKFVDIAAEGAEALGIDLSVGATTPNLGAPVSVGIRQLFRNAAGDVIRENIKGVPPIKVDFRGPTPPSSGVGPAPRPPVSPVAPVSPAGETPLTPTGARNIRADEALKVDFGANKPAPAPPEIRSEAARRFDEKGIAEARASAKEKEGSPTSKIIEDISDKMESGNPVLEIEHYGIASPGKPSAPETGKGRKKTRESGYQKLTRIGNLVRSEAPSDVVSLHNKAFKVIRWDPTEKNPTLITVSLDAVVANALRLAKETSLRDLNPYPIENNNYTPEGWKQLISDSQKYAANQANGYQGGGGILNLPSQELGLSIPAVTPEYTPQQLSKAKADFQNALQGIAPAEIARKLAPGKIPASIKGEELAKANARPVELPKNIPLKNVDNQNFIDFENRPIVEVNPLRNEMAARGFDIRTLDSSIQRITAKDIKSVKARPELNYETPVTDTIRGGFLPYYPKSELDAHIAALANGKESTFKGPKDVHFIGQYNSKGDLLGVIPDYFWTSHDANMRLRGLTPPEGTVFKTVSMSREQYKKDFYKGPELPPESKMVASGTLGHIPNSFDALDAHIIGEKPLAGLLPEQLHYLQFTDAKGNSWGTSETYFPSPEAAQKALAEYRLPSGVTGKAEVLPYDTYKNNLLGKQLYYIQFRDAQGNPTGTSGRDSSRYFSSSEEAQKAIPEYTLREGNTATVESSNAYKENQYEIKINKDSISEIKDYLKTAATEGPMTDETFINNYHNGYFDAPGHLSFEELNKRFPDAEFREEYADLNKEFTEETNSADAEVSKRFTDAAGDYQKEKAAADYARRRYTDIHEHLNSRLWDLQRREPVLAEETGYSYFSNIYWMSNDGTLYHSHYEDFAGAFLGGSENKALSSGWVKLEVGPINALKGAGHISVENKGGLTPLQQEAVSRLSAATKYEAIDSSGKSLSKIEPPKQAEPALTQKSLETVDWSEIRRDLEAIDPKEIQDKLGISIHEVNDLIEGLILKPERSPNSIPKKFQPAFNDILKRGRDQLRERGQSPGLFLPAPTEFRQKNLGGRTVEEFSDYVLKAAPTEWKAATENMTGGLTGGAWNLGLGLKDAADVAVLKSFQDRLSTATKEAMSSGDFDSAYSLVSKGQFFREAYEAATGTGSAGAAFKRGQMGTEGVKPPFPTTEKTQATAATGTDATTITIGESGAQFLPRTDSGRALEKQGFKIKPFGELGVRGVEIFDRDNNRAGEIISDEVRPNEVSVNNVLVRPNFRGKGVGEALYRELAAQLKEDGVKRVIGDVVAPEPLALRRKVFGDFETLDVNGQPASIEDALTAANMTKKGVQSSQVEAANRITSESQFLPAEQLDLGSVSEEPRLRVLPAAPGGRPPIEPPSLRPPPVAAGFLPAEELETLEGTPARPRLAAVPDAAPVARETAGPTLRPPPVAAGGAGAFLPKTESGRKLEEEGFEIVASGELGIRKVTIKDPEGADIAQIQAINRSPERAEIVFVNKLKEAPKGVGEVLYRELGAQLKEDGVKEITGTVVSPEPLAIRKKIFGDFKSIELNGEPASYAEALATTDRIKKRTENEVAAVEPVNDISGVAFLPKVKRDAQGRPLTKSGEVDYPRWQLEGTAARRKREAEPIEEAKAKGKVAKDTGSATGWILPNREFVPLDTAFHEGFLAENAKDLNKRFGTAFSETPSVEDRLGALNAGFVRFRYDTRSGNLLIEANAEKWPKFKSTVKRRLQDYEERITGFTLSLLNNKALQVDSVTVPRMQELSGPQKLEAIDEAVDSLRVPTQ